MVRIEDFNLLFEVSIWQIQLNYSSLLKSKIIYKEFQLLDLSKVQTKDLKFKSYK